VSFICYQTVESSLRHFSAGVGISPLLMLWLLCFTCQEVLNTLRALKDLPYTLILSMTLSNGDAVWLAKVDYTLKNANVDILCPGIVLCGFKNNTNLTFWHRIHCISPFCANNRSYCNFLSFIISTWQSTCQT